MIRSVEILELLDYRVDVGIIDLRNLHLFDRLFADVGVLLLSVGHQGRSDLLLGEPFHFGHLL